jgi:hypothetical protein
MTTEFGSRVARRLKELVIWLTTLDSLLPQPRPVWFVGRRKLLIFSEPGRTSWHIRHSGLP